MANFVLSLSIWRLSVSMRFSLEFSSTSPHLTRESWQRRRGQVRNRDASTCRYCGAYTPKGHADHIIPLSKGGDDSLSNLAWACPTCNNSKGDKSPSEWQATEEENLATQVATEEQRVAEALKEDRLLAEQVLALNNEGMTPTAIVMQVFGYKNSRVIEQIREILDNDKRQ